MRREELVSLRWEYVNMDERWLSVASTFQRLYCKGIVIGGPKTNGSWRTIALSGDTIDLLKDIRTNQLERRLAVGPLWQDNGYVFSKADGKPLNPDKVTNAFTKIVRDTGLPHLTLKGLRHAHATLLLGARVHPKIVSERLGHSNITMDIYSHVMPGMQEAAARAIDERLAKGS